MNHCQRTRFLLSLGLVGFSLLYAQRSWCAGAGLIPTGSTWKYLDNGTNQGTAWRDLDFEDDGWESGPAQLGYGDGDEATVVSFGAESTNKFITTYFRHRFDVTTPAAITNLTLRLLRDDGAVVYLNGMEVFRSNMPQGPITYTTLAFSTIDNEEESVFHETNINPGLLFTGPNILAVEVHQRTANSSDISFDLELDDHGTIVAITNPVNNTFVRVPTNILITANAVKAGGAITNVSFFEGAFKLGQAASSPYSFLWTNVSEGSHTLFAIATDDLGLTKKSAAVKILVGSAVSHSLTLIPAGSNWKYLDDGSDQGVAWRAVIFNDSPWKNGPAQLGYGDGDEATVVSFGPSSTNKYITTYFRHSFVISNASAFTNLTLRLVRDDGAVVYLNEMEVFRSNMPGGVVTNSTLASSSTPEVSAFVRTNLNLGLQNGTNVVAVEVHQNSRTSSDLSFDLELLGIDVPVVLRGPWLQMGTPTSVILKWRTDIFSDSRVRYGLAPANLNGIADNPALTNEHEVLLTGLSPATTYFYSIGTSGTSLTAGTDYFFTTAPAAGTSQATRIWAIGDSGTANVDAQNVRNAYYQSAGTSYTDLWLMLGDNAYNSGLDQEYQAAVFNTYPTLLRQTVLWPTIGNHETAQSSNPPPSIAYYNVFTLPTNGQAGGVASFTEDYYSFDYANIHFICLDSMTSSRATNGAMLAWLQTDLASTAQEWIIAFWHHPPYSKGSHNSDTEVNLIEMRQNALPILESYGVDLVLSGHSHCYERSYLLDGHYGLSATLSNTMKIDPGDGRVDGLGAYNKQNGLTSHQGAVYVVAGSSGKTGGGSLNHPAMFVSLNRLGSLVLDIEGNRLDAKFLREDGTTNDYFTILKGSAIDITDVNVIEGDSGTVNAVFTVSLSATNAQSVTVDYTTALGTATPDDDYLNKAGSLTFLAGTTNQNITVTVKGDVLEEADETFFVNLFNATSVALARSHGTGIILNEDSPPLLTIMRAEDRVVLSWPSASTGFTLESKTNLSLMAWATVAPAPVIVSGQYVVTNSVSTGNNYYRLRKP